MNPNDGRVISNFITQSIRNVPITIYGDGKQTRSFCYVSDLINAIYALMQTQDNVTGPINIGNPEEYTIKEMAQLILKMTQSSSLLTFENLPQDDPTKRKPDISLAYQEFHWKPVVSLQEGLQKTIEYYEKVLESSGQQTACNLP